MKRGVTFKEHDQMLKLQQFLKDKELLHNGKKERIADSGNNAYIEECVDNVCRFKQILLDSKSHWGTYVDVYIDKDFFESTYEFTNENTILELEHNTLTIKERYVGDITLYNIWRSKKW